MNRFDRAGALARGLSVAVFYVLGTPWAEAAVPGDVPSDINAAILRTDRGHVVELPSFALDGHAMIEYEITARDSPQFLISDDPEYMRVPEAVAMQETVEPGAVRLYVYNVNGVKDPQMDRKISVVIENLGANPLELRFLNRALPKPSGNYFEIGKSGLEGFLTSKPEASVRTIPVGGAEPLDSEMEGFIVKYDDLVHGFYEFEVSERARISVVQTDPGTPSPVALRRIDGVLPTKSKSGAGRGKFLTNNYDVRLKEGTVLDSAKGPQQLIVADGEIDPWVTGTESTTTTTAVLKGNYGVMYDIELERRSSDGRGLALVMWNARFGSQWCGGMAASLLVSEGLFEGGVVRVPSDRLITKSAPEVVVVQIFPPLPPDESDTIRITYSPPGASCLPTPLLFVPVTFTKSK